MKLFELYKSGGFFMNVVSIMAVLMLVVVGIKIYKMLVFQEYDFKLLGLIRMAGSFAAALGILAQILGIVQALEAIRTAGDISPQLVMGGAIISFYTTIWGLIVLLVSLLLYYVLKEVIRAKMPVDD
uniref:MotA/TolQ/ExbB proton channel family protein n=1 Tax=uncultured Draconibacterium sp. TaxID=1573823 RepID=UPI0032165DDB